jgi:transcription initiation factor TFIIH subunit 2
MCAVMQTSQGIPPFGSREVLVLLSSLTTCDPGSIADSMKAAKEAKLRVSIIGLSAEMYVSRKLATETGGTYHVAMSQDHLSELLTQACSPPPLPAAQLQPSLVKMAFPSKDADTLRSFAFVGEACEVATGAYSCPQCAAKNGSIPCNCHICGVTLISAPHLARSYHHLFPIAGFEEVQLKDSANQLCSFCSGLLPAHASGGLSSAGLAYRCSQCRSLCCMDCDDFVHEHLHNCPGCEELCNL